ncbi:hypothetical protein [Micromonospora noduli]|uniref:Uncharacterized protein n=1 Tax=Micromonospora noduli TaxID=709876 RepID=A0A328MYX8_9ACTN|nr:hypothetical protein [Micromonospora noduli]RAN98226.1 hypothetical protein LAH08_04210 [Micromonospora noduli]
MAELSAKAVRGETEKAALQLLRERANLVGEAATARHERDQLAGALRDANARYAERYTAALQGGWTGEELAKLGLDAPESAPARRRRAPQPVTPHTPGEQTAVADEAAQP